MFGTERKKTFDWNFWYSLPLFFKTFSLPQIFWNRAQKWCSLPNFSALSNKKTFRENLWYSPFSCKIFLLPGLFWKTEQKFCSPTNLLGTERQNFFDWNCYHSSASFSKLFRWQIFSETHHRRIFPLPKFSALWDKKLSTKTLDTPPSFPNYFRYRNVLKHSTEGLFPYQIVRQWETKKNRLKHLILFPPLFKTFSLAEIFWKAALKSCSPTNFFGTVRQKTLDWNFWYSFHSFSKLSNWQKLSETQHRRIVPLSNFPAPWDKKLSTKTFHTPHSFPKFFRYRDFSEKQHRMFVPLPNCSALRDKNFSTETFTTPPPLFQIFSLPELLCSLKHSTERLFPYQIFRNCETKKFQGNSWYSFPLFFKAFAAKILWNTAQKDCSPIKFSGTVTQKTFRENFWYSPFSSKIFFCYRDFSEKQHRRFVPLPNCSALRDKNFSTETFTTPPPLFQIFSLPEFLCSLKHSTERLFHYQIFRNCETKNFPRKLLILPLLFQKLSLPEDFWNTAQKGCSPTKLFGNERQKNSTETFDTPSPSFSKLFRCRKFSETEHRKVPLPNFSAQWYKKLSTETFDTPSPSFQNFFAARSFLKCSTEELFPHQVFRHCETKKLWTETFDTPSPLFQNFFATAKFSETQHRRNCSALREKKLSTETFDTLCPSFSKLFRCHKFSETEHRSDVPYQIFRHCQTKKLSAKTYDTPPSLAKFFCYRDFSEKQNRSFVPLPTCSALRDKTFSTETVTTPPPLFQNFFAGRSSLKHITEGFFPYQNFRHCETKNFPRKLLILPLLFQIIFATGMFWNTAQKGCSPTKLFGNERQKKSTETFDTLSPSFQNFFAGRNFLKSSTEELFTHQFFRHCKTKNFGLKLLILLPLFFKTF